MPDNPSHPLDQATDKSSSSEFTQMFGRPQPPGTYTPPAPGPFAEGVPPVPPSSDQGFTAIFGTAQPQAAASASPTRALDASQAPTQLFAAMPQPPRAGSEVSATDETRMFSTAAVPQHVPAARSAPVPVPPSQAASEFTSVFQPIAPPPPMAAMPAAPVAAPASGEFTQIFSAISARADVTEPVATPPLAPQTAPARPPTAPPAQAVAKPATPEPQAGEFTMLFGRQPSPQGVAGAVTPIAQPVTPKPETQPGSFTQVFSRPAGDAAVFPPASAPPHPAAQAPDAAAPLPSQSIFGAPAPRGSFTDLFAAASAPPPASATAGARLNDLFAAQPGPVSSPDWSAKPASALPMFDAPAQVAPQAPPATAAGDFTLLMQSLERPAAPSPVPASTLPVDAAFFAHTPAGSVGESEYTRVMRGGGAAPAASLPVATSAAGSAATPGLSLAPATTEKAPSEKQGKEKPKLLVILLVVMNVVLLLALIVFAFIFLHHR